MKYTFGRGQPNGGSEYAWIEIHHGPYVVGTLNRENVFTSRNVAYNYNGGNHTGSDLNKFTGKKFDSPLDCLLVINGVKND